MNKSNLSFFYNGSLVYLQKVLDDGKSIAVTHNRDKAAPSDKFEVGELLSIFGKKIICSEQKVDLDLW